MYEIESIFFNHPLLYSNILMTLYTPCEPNRACNGITLPLPFYIV